MRDRDLLILDFAYPREEMLVMAERASSIRVLDHHTTAQADLAGLPFATFDMERSGAGIAWDELHPGKERPWLVDYVEDRDLWRFKLPHSKAINAWIGAMIREGFPTWDGLLLVGPEDSRKAGYAVLAYVDRYVHEMAETARRVTFERYDHVPIVNAPYLMISELLQHLAKDAPLAIGWFQRADGMYQYSLRSSDRSSVDVSEIAKRFGGGGHKHAAGFQLADKGAW